MLYNKNTTYDQLDELPTLVILSIYNKAAGKSTTKFASRAKGIAQTLKALEDVEPKAGKKAPAKKADGPRKKPGMTFCLAPTDEQKTPRPGSKRAKVHSMLSRERGALFSSICETNEWNEKDGYEGVRLLNVFSGYGLWDDRIVKDGMVVDYRIRIVDGDEYQKLVVEAANEEE